jgi:hypothetical protein
MTMMKEMKIKDERTRKRTMNRQSSGSPNLTNKPQAV